MFHDFVYLGCLSGDVGEHNTPFNVADAVPASLKPFSAFESLRTRIYADHGKIMKHWAAPFFPICGQSVLEPLLSA